MTVRPIGYNADGSIVLVNDVSGHTGAVPPSAVGFVKRPDGSTDSSLLSLPCPDNCGATSTHPVAGGAEAPGVQELFTRTIARLGCPCSTPIAAGKPLLIAQAHAKLHAERMDGIGRWAIVGTLK